MFVLHLFDTFNSHITMHSCISYSVTAYKNVQLFNNYICAMGCTLATEKRKNPQGAQRQ